MTPESTRRIIEILTLKKHTSLFMQVHAGTAVTLKVCSRQLNYQKAFVPTYLILTAIAVAR